MLSACLCTLKTVTRLAPSNTLLMKPLVTQFLSVLLLVSVTTASRAQSAASPSGVTGVLTDEHGKALDFATVSLIRLPDSTVLKGTLTNEAGMYDFGATPAGKFIVAATYVGYDKAISESFTITAPQTGFPVPVLVMHSTGNTLHNVVITASQPLIEHRPDRTVMNIANSALATGNSALDILARAPGVTVDANDNISLRGRQSVTVMINDHLTYLSATQLAALLKATDGTTIQSIEIITNPSAKQDAAGSSGIINIRLKKSKQAGTNGSLTSVVGYGNNWRGNQTLSINHKEGNLNLYGSFSHDDGKYDHDITINRIVTDPSGNKDYFHQTSASPTTAHDNSYRIGADYYLTQNNTIGITANGYFDNARNDISSTTDIGSTPGTISNYLDTRSSINYTFKNTALNLNDRIKLDTLGQSLAVDVDYSKFNNGQTAQHNTLYFNPDGSLMLPSVYLRQQSPSTIIIRVAKADYTYQFHSRLKLETGLKFSSVQTDNNLTAQQQENGMYVNDSTLTNHFIYTERIGAGYINLTKSIKRTDIEVGLRGEYTASTGNLVTGNNVVKRNYFDLFPSIFLTHTINEKNTLGFSYSRRIDRPDYDALNPFIYYIDQYTYGKGNPFLNPQYTNHLELNYTYNKAINTSLSYSHTYNEMTNVLLTDPISEATYQTRINLHSQDAYTLNVNAPIAITKWWTIYADCNLFYINFKTDALLGANLNRSKLAYQAKLLQNLKLPKGLKLELISSYSSSLYDGVFTISPRYSNDIGLSRPFAHNRATIKLALTDVFNTLKEHITSNYQSNNIDLRQKFNTRVLRLAFTYNFGSDKIKFHTHTANTDELSGRVKGNN